MMIDGLMDENKHTKINNNQWTFVDPTGTYTGSLYCVNHVDRVCVEGTFTFQNLSGPEITETLLMEANDVHTGDFLAQGFTNCFNHEKSTTSVLNLDHTFFWPATIGSKDLFTLQLFTQESDATHPDGVYSQYRVLGGEDVNDYITFIDSTPDDYATDSHTGKVVRSTGTVSHIFTDLNCVERSIDDMQLALTEHNSSRSTSVRYNQKYYYVFNGETYWTTVQPTSRDIHSTGQFQFHVTPGSAEYDFFYVYTDKTSDDDFFYRGIQEYNHRKNCPGEEPDVVCLNNEF